MAEHQETPAKFQYQRDKKGAVYEKLPFRIELKKGREYVWCTCGQSKNQPLCDGSHKRRVNQISHKYVPHHFKVDETKEYWLCLCKQTNNRPFCDGSHRSEEVQAMRAGQFD